jgi:hypothetical protein
VGLFHISLNDRKTQINPNDSLSFFLIQSDEPCSPFGISPDSNCTDRRSSGLQKSFKQLFLFVFCVVSSLTSDLDVIWTNLFERSNQQTVVAFGLFVSEMSDSL